MHPVCRLRAHTHQSQSHKTPFELGPPHAESPIYSHNQRRYFGKRLSRSYPRRLTTPCSIGRYSFRICHVPHSSQKCAQIAPQIVSQNPLTSLDCSLRSGLCCLVAPRFPPISGPKKCKKKIKIKIKKIGHWEINFVKLAWGRTTILLISCSRLAFPERSVKLTGITFFRLRVKAHGS